MQRENANVENSIEKGMSSKVVKAERKMELKEL